MRIEQIEEARSNPDLNTRTDVLTQLKEYAGQKDIFVSFTSGFSAPKEKRGQRAAPGSKMGINPRSSFNTPLGIYTYPIDYLLNYINGRSKGDVTAPYTGEGQWQYLYVLRRTTDRYADSKTDVSQHLEELRDMVRDTLDDDMARVLIEQAEKTAKKPGDPQWVFWNTARMFADMMPQNGRAMVKWNVLMRRLGLDCFIDETGKGIIHDSEPTQAVFFTVNALRVVDVLSREKEANIDYYKIGALFREGKMNLSGFTPTRLAKLFDKIKATPEEFAQLAQQLGALQRKSFGEILIGAGTNGGVHWPSMYSFTKEYMHVMRDFGVTDDQIVEMAAVGYVNFPVIADLLDRPLSYEQWMRVLKESSSRRVDHGVDELAKEIATLKHVNIDTVRAILDTIARKGEIDPSYSSVRRIIKNSKIDLTEDFLRTLFTAYPAETTRDFAKEFTPTFQDWFRVARMNTGYGIQHLADIIPLEVAKAYYQREKKVRSMTEVMFARLVENDPKFLIEWLCTGNNGEDTQYIKGFEEFVTENWFTLVKKNPFFAKFPHPEGSMLNKTLLWRNLLGSRELDAEQLGHAIDRGLITMDELVAKFMSIFQRTPKFPKLLEIAYEIMKRIHNYPSATSELMVTLSHATGQAVNLKFVLKYLEMFNGLDVAVNTQGLSKNEIDAMVIEVVTRYPAMAENKEILYTVTDEVILHFIEQNDYRMYKLANNDIKYRVLLNLSTAHKEEFYHWLNDGRFDPLPTSHHHFGRYIFQCCVDKPVSDEVAHCIMDNYARDFAGKYIVSRAVMEFYIDAKPTFCHERWFKNPIPDDLLTKAQISAVKYLMGSLGGGKEGLRDAYHLAVNTFPPTAGFTNWMQKTFPDFSPSTED